MTTNHGRSFPTTFSINTVAWTSCYIVIIMIRIFLIRCVSLTSISAYYFISQNFKFLIIRNFAGLIGSQLIFYRSWLNKNVFLVQDLLGDDGKVLSCPEFFRKFNWTVICYNTCKLFLRFLRIWSMTHGDTTLIKLVFCLKAPSSSQRTFH